MNDLADHDRKWQMRWRVKRARALGEAEGYRLILRHEPNHRLARLMLRVCLEAAARRRTFEKRHEQYVARYEALDRAA